MKRLFLLLCLLLSVEVQALARTPLMPVDNLKAGMRGYAKTVISGDTIETFPVEVLGVTGSESMGYQILIRAGGDVLERSGGIAQGMSGSGGHCVWHGIQRSALLPADAHPGYAGPFG